MLQYCVTGPQWVNSLISCHHDDIISFRLTTNLYFFSFQGFYIYLYGVSVAFLLYVYVFLLRSRSVSRKCWQEKGTSDSLLRKAHRKFVSVRNHTHTGSFYLRLGAVGKCLKSVGVVVVLITPRPKEAYILMLDYCLLILGNKFQWNSNQNVAIS